jgi:Ca-activated chloride channel homolog
MAPDDFITSSDEHTTMRPALVTQPGLRPALAVALALSVAANAGGQEPAAGSDQAPSAPVAVFKSHSDLVVLQVNVFDGRSDAVEHLPQSAFSVYEDGVRQEIQFFQDLEVPVTAGLIVDNSSSMITRGRMVSAGVRAFAAAARDADELFTIIFNEHVRPGLPYGAFTRSHEMILASLARFPAGGRTALYDAVVDALAHIEQARNQKRVIVVLSDGDDNASRQSEANMLYRASRSQALIYTIHTGDLSSDMGNPKVLRKLAAGNGGVAYQPRTEKDVVDAFAAVGRNIRRGYSIGYVPTNQKADGSYRRVRVAARMPGRSLSVRVREGYTAEDADATTSR